MTHVLMWFLFGLNCSITCSKAELICLIYTITCGNISWKSCITCAIHTWSIKLQLQCMFILVLIHFGNYDTLHCRLGLMLNTVFLLVELSIWQQYYSLNVAFFYGSTCTTDNQSSQCFCECKKDFIVYVISTVTIWHFEFCVIWEYTMSTKKSIWLIQMHCCDFWQATSCLYTVTQYHVIHMIAAVH